MKEYQCTSNLLAEKCHISMAKVSRLRNGLIIPTKNSQLLKDIVATITELATQHSVPNSLCDQINETLNIYAEDELNFDNFKKSLIL